MVSLSRRAFLHTTAAVGAAVSVGACSSGGASKNTKGMTWWDHFGPLQDLQKQTFAKYGKAHHGAQVQYTFYNAAKMGQALQLAKQSGQLPDVHSNAGLLIPVPALIKGGWLQPIELDQAAAARMKGVLVDGIHIFDGKTYSFPIFSPRQYSAATWFNTELVKKAGLDPDSPPQTYDEFRAAAKAVQKKVKGVYGFIWNVGMPDRMGSQVDDMAQAGGFAGLGGVLFRTGEYAYHSDPYVNAIEFLVSLKKDKLLTPGSSSFTDKVARARWVTGIAAYYIDGPWCAGAALQDSADFSKSLGSGPMLVPDKGTPVVGYRGLTGGSFWLSKSTKHAKEANQLLSDYFTTREYYVGVAQNMDQPPRDLSAVADSSAHPAYKRLIKNFGSQVFIAPSPQVKNVDVTKVQAESTQVKPNLGDIVQGVFSGDITDIRGELKKLSDKNSADREKALKAATSAGAKAALTDWAFPNWKPRTDYTNVMYHQ